MKSSYQGSEWGRERGRKSEASGDSPKCSPPRVTEPAGQALPSLETFLPMSKGVWGVGGVGQGVGQGAWRNPDHQAAILPSPRLFVE